MGGGDTISGDYTSSGGGIISAGGGDTASPGNNNNGKKSGKKRGKQETKSETPKNKASAKGLIGHEFEKYLTEIIGGSGSFSIEGREFDGRKGNRWWEAKSGDYWQNLMKNPAQLDKFKSDMGHRN